MTKEFCRIDEKDICMLSVYRCIYTPYSTMGKLFINGTLFCYTLENAVRPLGVKIKGLTAIQAGEYDVVLSESNRFKRLMPEILKVPNFKGIRVHGGNTYKDTQGCILAAYKYIFSREEEKIWQTAEKDLTKELKRQLDICDEIHINIINANTGGIKCQM